MNRGIFTVIDAQAAAAQSAAAAAQDAANKAMQRANQANAAAAAAQATGTNAAASTADLAAAVAAGNSTHADLYSRLANIQLTPGPPGTDGRPGTDGSPGKAGADGKNSTVTIATGTAATPVLALNASADITITLTHAMPTNTYNLEPLPSAALLGNYSWTVKSKTTTTVVLTIKANLAIAASAIGLVAWASA